MLETGFNWGVTMWNHVTWFEGDDTFHRSDRWWLTLSVLTSYPNKHWPTHIWCYQVTLSLKIYLTCHSKLKFEFKFNFNWSSIHFCSSLIHVVWVEQGHVNSLLVIGTTWSDMLCIYIILVYFGVPLWITISDMGGCACILVIIFAVQ